MGATPNTVCVTRFANGRQESLTAEVCKEGSWRSLVASKSRDCDRNSLLGGVKAQQPSAVALLAGLEAINALLRTKRGPPGVVPDQTKLSVTDGAALRCVVPMILRMAAHVYLL
jgi:hypothetical protein